MYSVVLNGFKTKAQCQAFVNWYEGQGEQNSSYWFECRKDEGEIDIDHMYIDLQKPYEWQENQFHAWMNI